MYNVIYMLSSVPIGKLSDKLGRKPIIAASFLFYAAICIGFIFAGSLWQLAILFALYGIFVAADESVNKAYVSDMVSEKQRGIALGAYNSAVGAVYLPASVLFGALWASFGAAAAFGTAAVISVASGLLLLMHSK